LVRRIENGITFKGAVLSPAFIGGLGPFEILLVLFMAGIFVAVPIATVVVVIVLLRRKGQG
jgi:hypothetical protein